jgi:hypothetical protein
VLTVHLARLGCAKQTQSRNGATLEDLSSTALLTTYTGTAVSALLHDANPCAEVTTHRLNVAYIVRIVPCGSPGVALWPGGPITNTQCLRLNRI